MKKEYIIISIFAFVSLLICICLSIEQRINENVYPTETTIEAIKVDSIPLIDNPTPYINQDSIDRAELIRDSIQFRKITKKINGGYNGFADRYAIWLRARKALKRNKIKNKYYEKVHNNRILFILNLNNKFRNFNQILLKS